MNENKDQFYVLTSNNVIDLPPELARSGRLDKKWFFNFPSTSERKDIFNIHFKKAGKNIDDELLVFAANNSDKFTGAEIEDAVNNILINAFLNSDDGKITKENIIAGINVITPVYQTSSADINNMISYAKTNKIPGTSEKSKGIAKLSKNMDNSSNNKVNNGTDIESDFLSNIFG